MAQSRAIAAPLLVAATASIFAAWLAASFVFDASATSGSLESFQYLLFPAAEADTPLFADAACEGEPITMLDRALLNALDELGEETIGVTMAGGTSWVRRSDLRAWEPIAARRERLVDALNEVRLVGEDQRVRIVEADTLAGGEVRVSIELSDEPRWVRSEYIIRRDRVIPRSVSVRSAVDAVGATIGGVLSGCLVMLSSGLTLATAWWFRRKASGPVATPRRLPR